jgi:hypothetical protein
LAFTVRRTAFQGEQAVGDLDAAALDRDRAIEQSIVAPGLTVTMELTVHGFADPHSP